MWSLQSDNNEHFCPVAACLHQPKKSHFDTDGWTHLSGKNSMGINSSNLSFRWKWESIVTSYTVSESVGVTLRLGFYTAVAKCIKFSSTQIKCSASSTSIMFFMLKFVACISQKFNSATRRQTFRRLSTYYLLHPSGKELARSVLETRGWTLRGIWWTICRSHSDRANRCCHCVSGPRRTAVVPKASAASVFSSSRFKPEQLLSSVFLGTDPPPHQPLCILSNGRLVNLMIFSHIDWTWTENAGHSCEKKKQTTKNREQKTVKILFAVPVKLVKVQYTAHKSIKVCTCSEIKIT